MDEISGSDREENIDEGDAVSETCYRADIETREDRDGADDVEDYEEYPVSAWLKKSATRAACSLPAWWLPVTVW